MTSIFDEAANFKKKKKKEETAKPTPSHSKKYTDEDAEMSDIVKKMQEMKEHLKRQVAELQAKGIQKNIDIERFFSMMSKRFPEDVERMKKYEQLLAEHYKKSAKDMPTARKKSTEEMTQERKGKTLGLRKKWIRME